MSADGGRPTLDAGVQVGAPASDAVAELLRLPGRGVLEVGAHADLVVLDANLHLRATMAGGRWLVSSGRAVVTGPFG